MRKRATNKEIIKKTMKPVEEFSSGLDRINAIPNFTKKVKENFLADIVFQYSLMSRDALIAASKNKKLTVLELQVIVQLVDSLSKGKTAATSRAASHDRIAGKTTNKIEHSGPNGGAIAISDSKLVNNLGSMTKEELLKIKKAVTLVKSVNDSKNEAEEK